MLVKPATIVETPEFLSSTRKLMSEAERTLLVDYIAYNPLSGDLIQGGGGIRKLRWALAGRGKSGGSRVIYFYHNLDMPVFLLTAYAKNDRSNVTLQDVNDMKKLTDILVSKYKGKLK